VIDVNWVARRIRELLGLFGAAGKSGPSSDNDDKDQQEPSSTARDETQRMMSTGTNNGSNSKYVDPAVQQVARVYALALIGAAENAGQLDALVEEFDALVRDVLDPNPRFEHVLASGILNADEKEGILDRTLGSQASPLMLSFLKVLSKHSRLDCLRATHAAVHEEYNSRRGLVPVEVRTAVPLDAGMEHRLTELLKSTLGATPVLETQTDPSMIGGIVLRAGDHVMDGSVSTQLANMRRQMIDRSVHEIQSRRDHFRTPTGD